MSRTENSIRNIKYATTGQIFSLVISFVTRMVFIRILGAEYLGVNGLFTNILSILSLAELGIGPAIIYSMYKPLVERDEFKLKVLMKLYKSAYIRIGGIIAFLGTVLTPFLKFIIRDMPSIPNIHLIYLLYVSNTAISYLFSYKRSLIIADQKRYIVTFYRYSFFFLLNVLQIIILILTKKYIYYLLLQLIITLVENIVVSRKADKLYPFLTKKTTGRLSNNEKNIIIRNVKALISHKIGGAIVSGTDSVLISKFVNVVSVGLFSNYYLIINALNIIFGLLFQSITASIGNLGITETKEKQEKTFETINFIAFWIYSFSSICLINLLNPFVNIWIGKEYLFSKIIVLLIVINFYLLGMRSSVLVFKDALGLYWYDRFKPIFEAIIKIISSILLAKKMGIAGIFIGTTISTITTCFWIEPYVLYKHGLNASVLKYFMKYVFYTILMLIVGIITWLFCNTISDYGIVSFIIKMVVCGIVPNIIYIVIFWNNKEFKQVLKIIISMKDKFLNIVR